MCFLNNYIFIWHTYWNEHKLIKKKDKDYGGKKTNFEFYNVTDAKIK